MMNTQVGDQKYMTASRLYQRRNAVAYSQELTDIEPPEGLTPHPLALPLPYTTTTGSTFHPKFILKSENIKSSRTL